MKHDHNSLVLLTASDLVDIFHVRTATIRRWAKQGIIPSIVVSPRVIRFDLNAVKAAMAGAKALRGTAIFGRQEAAR